MPGTTQNELQATFAIDGLKDELRLISFRGSEGLSQLFAFSLNVGCTSNAIPLDELVGRAGLLTIEGQHDPRHVHGLVSRMRQLDSGRKYTEYQVDLVPRAWRLLHRHDCRIFQHQGMVDIISQVLDADGVEFEFHCMNNIAPADREYCVQYRESDWAFVSRLLEEEGYWYYFEHWDQGHMLHLGNGPVFHPAIPAPAEVPFREPKAAMATEEHIHSFHLEGAVHSGKVTLTDFNFLKPSLQMFTSRRARRDDRLERYDYPGLYQVPEEGRQVAEVRLEEARARVRLADGRSSCPRLGAGSTFTLDGHGRNDLNGVKYLVTGVEHRGEKKAVDLDQGALDQRCTYTNAFSCIPATVLYRPPRKTPRPFVQGVQTAIVVGPAGEEIYTDEHGRVKVQFHWDRLGQRDEESSCWIRVSQLWAGQGWGAMWIPRIGHEVIVDFLEGDPDRPIITGRVYHGQNVPPYVLPDHKTRSTIKSNSSPGGAGYNEIRFEDEQGSEEIYTHAQKDQNEVVENDMTTRVGRDQKNLVGRDRDETVVQDERVVIQGERTETVHKDENLHVRQNRARTVRGNQDVRIDGDNELTVRRSFGETVGRAMTLNVGAAYQVGVGAAMSLSVGAAMDQTVLGSFTESVGGVRRLEVDKRFELVCGTSRIIVEPDEIRIKGNLVKINCKEDLDDSKRSYDAGFVLVEGTKLITDRRYIIHRADGSKVEGYSDARGRTKRVATDKKEQLRLQVFPPEAH